MKSATLFMAGVILLAVAWLTIGEFIPRKFGPTYFVSTFVIGLFLGLVIARHKK
jgi:hypothetical protein